MADRARAWGDTLFDQALVSTVQVNLNLLTDLTPSDTITAIRLVGHLYLTSDNVLSTVDGAMRCDVGVQVVTAAALAAGGGAVPQVRLSSEVPARGWLWRETLITVTAVGAGPIDDHYVGEISFDIRSMRKVDRGVLIMSLESNLLHGTAYNTKISGLIRALCLT